MFDLIDGPSTSWEAEPLERLASALGWQPRLSLGTAIDWIADWHKQVNDGGDARRVTGAQIAEYEARFRMPRGENATRIARRHS